MPLADEIKTLEDLHAKGQLTDAEYSAAKATTLRSQPGANGNSKLAGSFLLRTLAILFIATLAILGILRYHYGNAATNELIAAAVHSPIQLTDEVENVSAHSWRALAFTLPYAGTLSVNLSVIRGNPVDVFVIDPDQLDAVKAENWNNIHVYSNFSATKTRTYERSTRLQQGSYYLVLRDTSLGILSSSASDMSLKIRLNP